MPATRVVTAIIARMVPTSSVSLAFGRLTAIDAAATENRAAETSCGCITVPRQENSRPPTSAIAPAPIRVSPIQASVFPYPSGVGRLTRRVVSG